jgi:hypothetical protein
MGISTPFSMAALVVYGQEVGLALQLVDDLKIRDVTVEKNKLNAMLGNIENTPWPRFKNIWEDFASKLDTHFSLFLIVLLSVGLLVLIRMTM